MLRLTHRSDYISNDSVEKAAKTRLARTGYPLLNTIECLFQDGTMELRGRVPSYYHKQLAQEAMRKVHDVKQLINNIEVS